MALYSREMIETVRERVDIVELVGRYLPLKRSGRDFLALCPFHQEKTPSFWVSPGKGLFYCFGCQKGGTAFHFLMAMEGLTFPEAVRKIADQVGIVVPKERRSGEAEEGRPSDRLIEANRAAARYFHQTLKNHPAAGGARGHLAARGISEETAERFLLGYALPGDDLRHLAEPSVLIASGLAAKSRSGNGYYLPLRGRLIIPIWDRGGEVIGFGGRALDEATRPKYSNTQETAIFKKGRNLYPMDRIRFAPREERRLVIVEGYFDAITAHQAQITSVAATLGTALTADHLRFIRGLADRVTLLFDPDPAGVRAAVRTAGPLLSEGVRAEVASLPSGEDPDAFVRKHGADAFRTLLADSRPLIEFVATVLISSHPTPNINDKKGVLDEVMPLIEQVKSPVERNHYLGAVARALDLDERSVREEFVRRGSSRRRVSAPASGPPAPSIRAEEGLFLSLLARGEVPIALLDRVAEEDFSDGAAREVVRAMKSEGTGDPTRLAGVLGEEAMALLSRLAIREEKDRSQEESWQAAEDCLLLFRRRHLKEEWAAARRRLAEAAGNPAAEAEILRHLKVLSVEMGKGAAVDV